MNKIINKIHPVNVVDGPSRFHRNLEALRELFANLFYSVIENEDSLEIHLAKPLKIIVHGDVEVSSSGEIGILSLDSVKMDAGEIHFNSRNCKQLRELKEDLLQEVLDRLPLPQIQEMSPEEFKHNIIMAVKDEVMREVQLTLSRK